MKRSAVGIQAPARLRLLLWALPLLFLLSLSAAGPLQAAEFYWSTSFNASEEYNDNIYLNSEDPEDDFITLLSESFTLGIRTEEIDTAVNFSIGYAFYEEREDSGDIRGALDLSGFKNIPISENWVLDLDESFTVTEDPVEFGPATEATTETPYYSNRNERTRYYRNRFRGELAYQFGEEDEFYWGYGNTLLENDSNAIQDSMKHQPFAGLRYWFGVHHGLDLSVRYTRAEFDPAIGEDAAVSDFDGLGGSAAYHFRMDPETTWSLTYSVSSRDFEAEDDSDYLVHNAGLGLTRQITETLSATADVGYYWQDLDDESDNSNGGPSASLSLTRQFETGTLQVSGSMGFREQFFEAENLGPSEYHLIRASYEFQAAENLNVSTGAGYFENEYLEMEDQTEDRTWYGDISLSYRLLERLSVGLHYNHQDRNGSEPEEDYKVNSVMLMFSIPYEGRPHSF